MSLLRQTRFAGAAFLIGALPAHAQVTPEQVWTMWQDLTASIGYSLTADAPRRDGDRLVLSNVIASGSTPTAQMRAPIAEVVLRDRGDGTVEVTMSPSFDLSMKVTEPDAKPVDMVMRLAQQGYVAIVSGTPEAPKVDVTAASLTLSQIAPKVDGTELPMTMVATLRDLTSTTALTRGDTTATTATFGAGSIEVAVDATNPENGGTMKMTMRGQDLDGTYDGALPATMAPGAELPDMLNAGLRGEGRYAIGPMTFAFDMAEGGKTTNLSGSTNGTDVEVGLTPDGLRYAAGATGLEVAASGDTIPFPDFRVTAGEYRLGLTMPLTKSDTPSDFGLLVKLADLTLPEGIWAMIDPQARLPRDPATVELDATGKATLFADLTSQAAQEPDASIGQVEALTVNKLLARLAGAELTGTGAFTFDNTDLETIPGMPRPAGAADLKLTGGNALLDNLVAMGLVPQDQLMGVRMMLALFTRPGDGPDTLTSKIEMTPEGQILANGQRIQ